MITANEAQQFLTQATFGPSAKDIAALIELGDFEAWIDQQWDLPVSLQQPYVERIDQAGDRNPRHDAWWINVMEQPDQLRQRVAFALSQIFVVSDLDYSLGNAQYAICQFYDLLAQHADANYRDLLEAITLHPVMGIYLSMLRNRAGDAELNIRPDENFAREVLQLFSIGLHELEDTGQRVMLEGRPVPTFDQATIENFARVFTGWNFNGETAFESNDLTTFDKTKPMWAVPEMHDSGPKTLLGGEQIPAGLSPEDDLGRALDNIFAHSNVGPFIAKLLIGRLVSSNPSEAYVQRVAAVFDGQPLQGQSLSGQGLSGQGSTVRGDLGATVKAILLDEEARSGTGQVAKVKEPLLRLSQFWRAMNAFKTVDGPAPWRTYDSAPSAIANISGQAVMRSPSVFNFFQPDYSPPESESLSPEMQIYTEANVGAMNNVFHTQIYGFNNRDYGYDVITRIDVEREISLAQDIDELVNHLDDLLLGGAMSDDQRQVMLQHLSSLPDDADGRFVRALDAIFMVAGSPEFMVQR